MTGTAIVVSGLPASGKTSIGKALASELALPFLDKDLFLETLFDERGIGDGDWRRRLSMEADIQFEAEACRFKTAVLVSHWRPGAVLNTGTPTEWIDDHFSRIVEVHCACSPETAAGRFYGRRRHRGHLDDHRTHTEIRSWLTGLAPHYPLGMGSLVEISTETWPMFGALTETVKGLMH